MRLIWALAGIVLLIGCTAGFAPAHAAPKPFRDCAECPSMVRVPAGNFLMGSPASEEGRTSEEGPQHKVHVPAFAIARFETTFEEWDACQAASGCERKPDDAGWGHGNLPVIDVGWDDAQQYVTWLSRKTGKHYRLLTEAEWEYAARAGAQTPYSWGKAASHEYANYGTDDCCGGRVFGRDKWLNTAPVGSFPANAFGVHDLLGNVWEWVEDCWNETYDGAPVDGSAWIKGDCDRRILRGGSWSSLPVRIRAAFRDAFPPDDRDSIVGFRVARSL